MSWWYSKPVEDNKYVMIEDKMEAFQNTISKLQSEIENLKCEKDSLIVIVANLRKDFEKQKLITDETFKKSLDKIETLKNDFENYKIKPIEPEPIWYDTIDYMKPEHISKEIYMSPLELLKKDEKDSLDEFINGVLEIPTITAEEGTIKIGGGLEVEDCHIETKEDKPIRKSERLKNKNLKRTKRISYNNREIWKI